MGGIDEFPSGGTGRLVILHPAAECIKPLLNGEIA
jgi:hypothetical protein